MSRYIIGVEGATRSSTAALMDLQSMRVIAITGPGVNFHCYGDLAYKNLSTLLRGAVTAAGLDVDEFRKTMPQLTLGIPGAFGPIHSATAELMLLRAGWNEVPHAVVDDTEIALEASGLTPPAIVGIVGVGTGILGFVSDGKKVKVDGWGPVLGDGGSGYDIGARALHAILQGADGRGGECTVLRDEVFAALATHDVRSEEGLVSWFDSMVDEPRFTPWRVGLANLTQAVAKARSRGDSVATTIFEDAAKQIVDAIRVAATRMHLGSNPPVALEGFVLREHDWFASDIADQLVSKDIAASARVSRFMPVYGAILLALRSSISTGREEAAELIREAMKNTDEESQKLVIGRNVSGRRRQGCSRHK